MIYVSRNGHPGLIEYLKTKDGVTLVGPVKNVGAAIDSHPDILFCRLGGGRDAFVYKGNEDLLGEKYPEDCRYNAVVLKDFIIHKRGITDEALLKTAGPRTFIDVPQGYTKCNTVVADDTHIITSDEGICKAVSSCKGISCLLVSPGQISLPGYRYGFIGGCSGRVGDEIIFNGNLEMHSDFERIKAFIEGCGLTLKYFPGWELTDIGSITEGRQI